MKSTSMSFDKEIPLPAEQERRAYPDRRRKPTPFLSRYTITGSRQRNRRAGDRDRNYYVDIYSKKWLLVILTVLSMCILDGLFTIELMNGGASEMNLFMNFIMNIVGIHFLIIKYAITVIGLAILLMHKNFHIFKGRISVKHIFALIFSGYALLISYEAWALLTI